MRSKLITTGAATVVLGVILFAETVREFNLLWPLPGYRLKGGEAVVRLPFRPRVSDYYEVRLWAHHPNTPLDEVSVRLNAVNRPKSPGPLVDLSWQIRQGTEVVAQANIADARGHSVNYQRVTPLWSPVKLHENTAYVLEVSPPQKDEVFYAWHPEISVTIGEEFWSDSGYRAAPALRQLSYVILFIGVCTTMFGIRRGSRRR